MRDDAVRARGARGLRGAIVRAVIDDEHGDFVAVDCRIAEAALYRRDRVGNLMSFIESRNEHDDERR